MGTDNGMVIVGWWGEGVEAEEGVRGINGKKKKTTNTK